MPQGDVNQTFKSNQFRHEEPTPNELMTVEFRPSDPSDFANNPMRMWARTDTGDAYYTVDGITITTLTGRMDLPYVNVKWFGAKGDGTTNDTAAIQTAINFSGGKYAVFFPQGRYIVSSEIICSTKITLLGEVTTDNVNSAVLKTANTFAGTYIFKPTDTFVITNMSFRGNNTDGIVGLGNASGSFTGCKLDNVKFYDLEYGIRFSGTAQFPVMNSFKDVWMFNVRTAGLEIAASVNNGQSAMTMDNVVISNLNSVSNPTGIQGISASNVVVTQNVTPTTDSITWSSTNAKEFGWVVMRKPAGSTDINSWVQIAAVDNVTTNYVNTKLVGEVFDYAIVRHTVGMYIKYLKSVNFGSIQCEYFGTGLLLDEMFGVSLNAFYYEWRGGVLNSPIPRGNGIQIRRSYGVTVSSAWTENALSAVFVDRSGCSIHQVNAFTASRSAVHLHHVDTQHFVEVDTVKMSGTPIPMTNDSPGISKYKIMTPTTDGSLESIEAINHNDRSGYGVYRGGVLKGMYGVTSKGSYVNITQTQFQQMLPVDVLINNTIFVDSSDNVLKYKDNTGAIKIITLT